MPQSVFHNNNINFDEDQNTLLEKTALASCTSKDYGLVIQNIQHRYSLHQYSYKVFNMMDTTGFAQMVQLHYLIYMTLDKWRNVFTHYDLHSNNVVLYEIPNQKYIEITIKYSDGDVILNSTILPIIIDYGRSYMDCEQFDAKLLSSKKIISKVCDEPECFAYCGDGRGFNFVGEKDGDDFLETDKRQYYINTARRNISHDLRLLYSNRPFNWLEFYIRIGDINTKLLCHKYIELLKNVIFYGEYYGAPENLTENADKIYNVTSAHKRLKDLIPFTYTTLSGLSSKQKYGSLTIFADTNEPYIFEFA